MNPHPSPWFGSGYLEVEVRERFKYFESEPWFKQLVIAYCRYQDEDYEWGAEEVVQALEASAQRCGIALEPRRCNFCDARSESVDFENPLCVKCK